MKDCRPEGDSGAPLMLQGAIRFSRGDDVFISYSRANGATYAAGLASELARRKLSCRLDQWGAPPGKEVPEVILTALKRSARLVVVTTAACGQSAAVEREIRDFLLTGRLIMIR